MLPIYQIALLVLSVPLNLVFLPFVECVMFHAYFVFINVQLFFIPFYHRRFCKHILVIFVYV